ncbi:hypothetical protein AAVH_20374 [Aphelenchoides avenae]|nr:hypothetical protein AAVH_20374 [Aphelenchus avenae]
MSGAHFDVDGTLLDFSSVCTTHKTLRLSDVGIGLSCAGAWTAKNVYEITRGVQVAECLQLAPAQRALFFTNNSPLASTADFEPPTEDNLVRIMVKLVTACKARHSAFEAAMFQKLTCSTTARQAALKLSVAERVRSVLDGKKTLRSDTVIVLGGTNAQLLADALGATFVKTPTVPDALRAASVLRSGNLEKTKVLPGKEIGMSSC